jgi:DMSO/TMAO reductase YedYZ molybdopterin-dependent catalytic subunit
VLTSLEPAGPYKKSRIFGPELHAALLATHLNHRRLTIDHGYPLRLIAPNRAGVFNTKWLSDIKVVG